MNNNVYLSFDLWNTIIEPNPDYVKARNEYLADLSGMSTYECHKIHKEVKSLLDKFNDYGISFPSQGCWELLYNRLNTNSPSAFLGYRIWQILKANPPYISNINKSFLKEVSQKYNITILSNTNFIPGQFLAQYIDNLMRYDVAIKFIFSDEEGYAKPDIRFFEKLKFPKNDPNVICCHFGDNDFADIQGAKNYGIESRKVLNPTYFEETVTNYLREKNVL